MYFFYILRCADNSLYCGQTTDIDRRVKQHNAAKGAKYTRSHGPVELVYYEEYENLSLALKREIEVKKWSKKQKELLVTTSPIKR